MNRFVLLLLVCCAVFPAGLFAQQCSEAQAQLVNDHIRIGEQAEVKLEVHYCEGVAKTSVVWPDAGQQLMPGIDVLSADSIQTKLVNRAAVLYKQTRSLTISSIDTGRYEIPPFKFVVGPDTVRTNPLTLYVTTIAVDTTKPIKDIKGIYDVPPAPPEVGHRIPWWIWALTGVLVTGIIVLIVLLVRKKKIPAVITPERTLLPHERVLEQLAELGRKKPWLSGDLKGYHVSLTEIMRGWLTERYKIPALEMTTGEMIRRLRREHAPAGRLAELERLLQTADLVKFAKAFPDNEENERNLQLAMNFVQATAIYPPQPQSTLTQP